MNFFFTVVLIASLLPCLAMAIRCYKCDATSDCKTIAGGSSTKTQEYSSDNVEVVDCEHHCWKSVSLGNVYRGCANKRCAISHSVGSFSSSVCCQADYCNGSNRKFSTKYIFLLTIFVSIFFI